VSAITVNIDTREQETKNTAPDNDEEVISTTGGTTSNTRHLEVTEKAAETLQQIDENPTEERDALDNSDNNNWHLIRNATTTRIASQQDDEQNRPRTIGRRTTQEKILALH
jgi:hypothetical protein